ncbi:hypothetical protein WAI453_001270 [Rhynchosporium graminicola]
MNSQVFTGPHVSVVVLKTGSTSHPKLTFYNKDELPNLFYADELYGGFLLGFLSFPDLTIFLAHLPIGGACTSETTIQYMRESSAAIVFDVVTTLVKLAEYLLDR